jgi:hypothetical protein
MTPRVADESYQDSLLRYRRRAEDSDVRLRGDRIVEIGDDAQRKGRKLLRQLPAL